MRINHARTQKQLLSSHIPWKDARASASATFFSASACAPSCSGCEVCSDRRSEAVTGEYVEVDAEAEAEARSGRVSARVTHGRVAARRAALMSCRWDMADMTFVVCKKWI